MCVCLINFFLCLWPSNYFYGLAFVTFIICTFSFLTIQGETFSFSCLYKWSSRVYERWVWWFASLYKWSSRVDEKWVWWFVSSSFRTWISCFLKLFLGSNDIFHVKLHAIHQPISLIVLVIFGYQSIDWYCTFNL